MTDTPTPGQVNYEAYWRALAPQYGGLALAYAQLSPLHRAAWEAAALAACADATARCVSGPDTSPDPPHPSH